MNKLTFEAVRFNPKYERSGRVYIDFTVNGFPFYLCFTKRKTAAKWKVVALMHDGFTEEKECPFCKNEDEDICVHFPVELKKVTQDLLSKKEIRLKALMKGLREEDILY